MSQLKNSESRKPSKNRARGKSRLYFGKWVGVCSGSYKNSTNSTQDLTIIDENWFSSPLHWHKTRVGWFAFLYSQRKAAVC